MVSMYSIATSITVKLYGGEYTLYPYDINDNLSSLIYKFKLNNNISFDELSKLTGYSTSYLCNLYKGICPCSYKLYIIINNLIYNNEFE